MSSGGETCTVGPFEVADSAAMHELGLRLGRVLRAGDLLVLSGPLGAGKTTLTRGIGEGLGVRGPVQSPTFVLARTHPSLSDGPPLVHVDAYRLSGPEEVDDLDLDFAASVVVAEWGRGLVTPEGPWIEVEIERPTGSPLGADSSDSFGSPERDLDEPRTVTLRGYGARWERGII